MRPKSDSDVMQNVMSRARISMQMHVFIQVGYTSQTLQIFAL